MPCASFLGGRGRGRGQQEAHNLSHPPSRTYRAGLGAGAAQKDVLTFSEPLPEQGRGKGGIQAGIWTPGFPARLGEGLSWGLGKGT